MTRIVAILAAATRILLCQDALHTYIAAAAMWGIWSGLAEIHRPTAMIVVSSIVLAGVVYARTRNVTQ